jgi:1-acyl-sn-glycerol-3-phosphate acyltransferase
MQRLAWWPLRASMTLFCGLEVRGLEHVRLLKSNAIYASNHGSEFDPLLIVACLPFFSKQLPLFFASREKNYYAYKGGWKKFMYGGAFFKLIGAYQVYKGLHDYRQALVHHLLFLEEGYSVCVFPTGNRSKHGEVRKARGGVAFLALETKLPVVPVKIDGLTLISFKEFLQGKRKVIVTFGPPLFVKDIFVDTKSPIISETQNDYETAAEKVMEKVHQLS